VEVENYLLGTLNHRDRVFAHEIDIGYTIIDSLRKFRDDDARLDIFSSLTLLSLLQ
jgi:hypothetical protein